MRAVAPKLAVILHAQVNHSSHCIANRLPDSPENATPCDTLFL